LNLLRRHFRKGARRKRPEKQEAYGTAEVVHQSNKANFP
jgi:hypothetical protein